MASFVWLSLLLMFLGDPVTGGFQEYSQDTCLEFAQRKCTTETGRLNALLTFFGKSPLQVEERCRDAGKAECPKQVADINAFLNLFGKNKRSDGDSDAMERRIESCMNRMKKNPMMERTFTGEMMRGVCHNKMTWATKVSEMSRQDPTMRTKIDSMSQPVKDYYNSLGTENKRRRSTGSTPRPRKEYRMLTAKERQSFHEAINAMKNTTVGNINQYDAIVWLHRAEVSPGAHRGPALLGWHREYLIRMERALQKHDSSVMLPYWDSTLDNNLGDLANKSIMWSEEFMGNGNGQVVTGPFANWETPQVTGGMDGLWRAAGESSSGGLYSEESVDDMISIDDFRNNTWHVNTFVEAAHDLPHLWVGGPMGTIEGSPSDPVFFTHHSFVDMLWELQEQRVYSEGKHDRYVYPPEEDHEAYGVGQNDTVTGMIISNPRDSFHFITNPMLPFEHLINADGHRDTYRLLYNYAPRPSCSRQNPTCGSPYLFCIDEVYKCAPKLQLGANCKGFESSDCCYEGICEGGVCKSIP